jgi:transcriptional regulator with XRE-family HTH domain
VREKALTKLFSFPAGFEPEGAYTYGRDDLHRCEIGHQTNAPQPQGLETLKGTNMNKVINIRNNNGTEAAPEWHGMDEEDLRRPGAALLVWLIKTAVQRGDKMHQLAAALGVTYGYLVQLKKGIRATTRVSEEVIRAAARYLGVPAIAVRLAVGQVTLSDFDLPGERFSQRVDNGLDFISKDPAYSFLLPPGVEKLDVETKAALVVLYEGATGARLLSNRDHLLNAVEQLHDLLDVDLAPRVRKAAAAML